MKYELTKTPNEEGFLVSINTETFGWDAYWYSSEFVNSHNGEHIGHPASLSCRGHELKEINRYVDTMINRIQSGQAKKITIEIVEDLMKFGRTEAEFYPIDHISLSRFCRENGMTKEAKKLLMMF